MLHFLLLAATLASGGLAAWYEIRLRSERRPEFPKRGMFALPRAFEAPHLCTSAGQVYQERATRHLVRMYLFGIGAVLTGGLAW